MISASNTEIITYCREQFNFELPTVTLARHTNVFWNKLRRCDNYLIKMLCVLNRSVSFCFCLFVPVFYGYCAAVPLPIGYFVVSTAAE